MEALRTASALAILVACMAACNGLTGVGELGLEDEVTEPSGVGTETAQTPAKTTGDAATTARDSSTESNDSGAPIVDAGAGDVVVDSAPPAPCAPVSVGPRYGSAANGFQWTNDNGILAPNDNQVAHSNDSNDNPITVSGFGFALPPAAQIKGIKLDFARNTVGPIRDDAVTLAKGSPKANGAWPFGDLGGPYPTTTYGGPTDTWGTTWTADEINATTFSVSVKVMGSGDGHADSLGVTVYYCP